MFVLKMAKYAPLFAKIAGANVGNIAVSAE
jgi:hypothetical protein